MTSSLTQSANLYTMNQHIAWLIIT
jgi:hypothetical protein